MVILLAVGDTRVGGGERAGRVPVDPGWARSLILGNAVEGRCRVRAANSGFYIG